jgi:hypothetical protein
MKKIKILTRLSQKADTSEEESAIGEMVYELYGLSEEEVRIVEGRK